MVLLVGAVGVGVVVGVFEGSVRGGGGGSVLWGELGVGDGVELTVVLSSRLTSRKRVVVRGELT